jgi:hypothetical protein
MQEVITLVVFAGSRVVSRAAVAVESLGRVCVDCCGGVVDFSGALRGCCDHWRVARTWWGITLRVASVGGFRLCDSLGGAKQASHWPIIFLESVNTSSMDLLISGSHGVALQVADTGNLEVDVYSVSLERKTSQLITPARRLVLDECGEAVAAFNSEHQIERDLPDGPSTLLVKHVELFKNNLYGFHLVQAQSSATGDIEAFAAAYSFLFAMELSAVFGGLSDLQRASLDRALPALECSGDSSAQELGYWFKRWRALTS